MQNFWVSVTYDTEVVLNNCFTVSNREEAVERMVSYLRMEFDLPRDLPIKVNHH